MKLYKSFFIGLVCAGAIVTSAQATPIFQTINFVPNQLVQAGTGGRNGLPEVTFGFDFEFNAANGFVSGKQYTVGTLELRLTDVNAGEAGTVSIGTPVTQSGNTGDVTNNSNPSFTNPNQPVGSPSIYSFSLDMLPLQDVSTDGVLHILLKATSGDFYISQATLTLDAINSSAVPEPASLALLGLGLAGIAALRRRNV